MFSALVLLPWIAYEQRRYPLAAFSLLAILVNITLYNTILNTWAFWIWNAYLGHFFLLLVIVSLVRRHGVGIGTVIGGMVLLTAVFFTPGQPWYLKNELSRLGLYMSMFALVKVPQAQIAGVTGRIKRRIKSILAEPAHIILVYALLSAASDIIKIAIGGPMEKYMLHTVNPNLFIAMLFAWVWGMYQRKPIPIVGDIQNE